MWQADPVLKAAVEGNSTSRDQQSKICGSQSRDKNQIYIAKGPANTQVADGRQVVVLRLFATSYSISSSNKFDQ